MNYKLIERLKRINKIQSSDLYIDRFLSSAVKTTSRTKIQIKFGKAKKIKSLEKNKIINAYDKALKILEQITNSFSNVFALNEIYQKLLSYDDIEFDEINKAIDKITKVSESLNKKLEDVKYKLKKSKETERIYSIQNSAIGFLTSKLERLNNTFTYLENARKILRNLPYFKDDHITVAISGFPNVGKSTLLKKITTADPEIQPYSFTTKGLNLGYYKNYQFIDTPGTLNRTKLNKIEQKAELILTEVADKIIFVVDSTLGYGIDKNKKLYDKLKKLNKPIIIYVSMTDIESPDKVREAFGNDVITDAKEIISKL